MKTYNEWIEWLEKRSIMPQIRPGLMHTENALHQAEILPRVSPDKVIHIAGTNGKGTTAKTLEQLLLKQGYSVGLYTSPHLVDTNERICLNGKNISHEQMIAYFEKYQPLIEKWNLSHFETLTLFSAALFFVDSPVDYAIYEIGLGGTWDATNIIPHSTSVITTLGFDHQHILGDTLSEIADNKFGIIQKNNHVLHFPYDEDIELQLAEKLNAKDATSACILPPEVVTENGNPLPQYFIKHQQKIYLLSLPGTRAAHNMWMALHIFETLGHTLEEGLPRLKDIEWPARMTQLAQITPCPVYLSGDHNIQGLESAQEIILGASYNRIKILFGLSKNRVHKDFLKILEKIPRADIFLTQPRFGGVEPIKGTYPYTSDPCTALRDILQTVQPNDMVLVTGSLYLCGDILKGDFAL